MGEETVFAPSTIFPTWEATILTTESPPVASLERGFFTRNKTIMDTVLDPPTGGHMETTLVWILLLNSATLPAVLGTLELLMTGNTQPSTSTSTITSLGTRSSRTTTCLSSTTMTGPGQSS